MNWKTVFVMLVLSAVIIGGGDYGIYYLVDKHLFGHIVLAEKKLWKGQTFECITSFVNQDGKGWVGIVQSNGQFLGLRFKEHPPIHGVMAEVEGRVVFLQTEERACIAIPNPLYTADASAPQRKKK